MKCAYSREILALYVEDDLPTSQAFEKVKRHVSGCPACQEYCDQLQKSQSFIKARFRSACREAVRPEALAGIRRSVLAQIESSQESLGWAVRLERLFMLGFRRQRFALAGFAIAAIVSVSLLGQIQYSRPQAGTAAAVFVGKNTLVRPAGYREWVFVGSSLGLGYSQSQGSDMYHNVYIDPAAYRAYASSGKFPEGTVMILEMVSAETKKEPGLQGSYEKDFMGLEVSVKDSARFQDGWGYFNFTQGMGTLKSEAEPLPQNAGCVSCHREKAATDFVFTQFYPVLRSARS